MSTITKRLVARFDRWLDRLVATDDRFVCAACDNRFHSHFEGTEHVLHCHPEYQGVVIQESTTTWSPASFSTPARRPLAAGLTPAPVRVAAPFGH